ncbi:MAG: hypothetical protein GX781_04305 [Clostridiales bacterium]|nr:hypothetical protein [Clostridiales bacterium]
MKKKPTRARAMALSLVLLFIFSFFPFAQAASLAQGDRGPTVKDLKIRLFDLGYLRTVKDADERYSAQIKDLMAQFQAANGLPVTGIADPLTLERVYSDSAIKAPLPPNRPLYNIEPDARPALDPEVLPPLDIKGYLAGGDPFVYQDREAGLWFYLSQRIKVSITRFYQTQGQIEWFEVYVSYRDEGKPFSIASAREGAARESPLKLAEEAAAIVAINDDFYHYRVNKGLRTGIVVRQSQAMTNSTYKQNRSRIPSLEVMALFEDGTLKTFASDAHTAQGYIDMGVTDTWAFGPALVQEGEVPRYFYSKDYRSYIDPRSAIGMIDEGVYCALVITGRKEGSRGAAFGWMAEKMAAMGAREALNLDGGGSSTLVFMGEMLNKSASHQTSRSVSGLIGFK